MARQSFFIFLLICLAGFLILPNISLGEENSFFFVSAKASAANDFDDIDLREVGKYLELSEKDTQNLLFTLKQVFTTDWIYRESSGLSTNEECLVPLVLRKVVRIQALNHLLIDAPIQITWKIVKNATKIARVFLAQDPSVILNELEKQSVKKAVDYGLSVLFENEIRVTPGAIEYEYISQRGIEQKIIIQYILIYQPLDNRRGNVIIRFYSPQPIEPPKSEGSIGITIGTPHSVQGDLPSFTVEIKGLVEDYKWVGNPSMKIDFPPEVPDLGIKPLSWWERYVLKPIESTIKDVEIIITKVTGKSLGLTDIWEGVKSFISKITSFSPATIFSPLEEKDDKKSTIVEEVTTSSSESEATPVPTPSPPEPEISLEELQEMLDDIAEKMDILARQISDLTESKLQEIEKETKDMEDVEEMEEVEEEVEKEIDKDEQNFASCVNINTASKEELEKIRHIGEARAEQIIKLRKEKLFSSVDELGRVDGIGLSRISDIKEQGLACVGDEAPEEKISAGGGILPLTQPQPQITLSYPQNNPVDQEIQVTLSASNLKNTTYDVKISIENEGVLSDIYNKKENKWQTSFNYVKEVFSGTSFSGNFKLRIKDAKNSFRGEADIFARVRENGKSSYLEFEGKINITDSEQATSTPAQEEEGEEETPTLAVVINEIAWIGAKANSADEWVELYNNTTSTVDITGWRLVSSDGSPDITFSTSSIAVNGYYLIERTDETTVGNISADLISSFGYGLSNDGERLELRNASGTLIDLVDCSSGWFAGNNETKQTMERINPNKSGSDSINWANNNLITRNGLDANDYPIYGTPKAENSVTKSQTEITQQNLSGLFDQFDKITLTYYGSPYITSGLKIPENKTLSIEPGIILQFRKGYLSYETGSLIIEGVLLATSSQEKIVFTSIYDENYKGEGLVSWQDRWRGLRFYPSSQGSELENVLIRYAGYYHGQEKSIAVLVDNTSIKLKNSVIENTSGLYLKNSSSEIEDLIIQNNISYSSIQIFGGNPTIKNSKFINNYSGIIIEDGSKANIIGNYFEGISYPQGAILVKNSYPILKDNTGQNNILNGIYLLGSVAEDWTLYPNNDFPYIIKNFQIASSSVIIEPGVIIKFEKHGKLEVEGKLFAAGVSDSQIIFTSVADDDYGGDTNNNGNETQADVFRWNRVYFSPSSEGSWIKNAKIRYGGFSKAPTPYRGAIYVLEAKIELEDLIIENAIGGYGLYIENSPETIVADSHFKNMSVAIQIIEECPQLSGLTFESCNNEILAPEKCGF